MDSRSSGSMQSSSTGGGDEEYDSRVESSISAFLNNPPPSQSQPFSATATNHIPIPQHNHHNTHMLDPLSNYLDPIQRSHPRSSLLNLDMMWSKVARSEPNPSDLGGLIPCSISTSSSQNQQGFLTSQITGQTRGVGLAAFPTTHHSSMAPPESASRGGLLSDDQAHNNNNNNSSNSNMVRNPKKRPRASRRAPTTVLTTDTTNFRAMVQEFTGIPAPPFTSSSFPRTRLDLFGSASTIRSLDIPPQPPYLLRPFAQKRHPFPPSSTSSTPSMVDNSLASNHSTNNLSTNSTSINYQLSSSSSADHLGLLKQQQQQPLNVMNNMHNNQILSFQSILQGQAQPNLKYPPGNSSKTQPSLEIPNTVDSHLKMSVLEELGLSHAHVNTVHVSGLHHNMVSSSLSSDGVLSRVNNNNNIRNPSSADWVQRTSTLSNNNDGDDNGGALRSLGGTGNYSNNIHGEKGPECTVTARSEGMVESWINCSSD